jgi:hypothetical protein
MNARNIPRSRAPTISDRKGMATVPEGLTLWFLNNGGSEGLHTRGR